MREQILEIQGKLKKELDKNRYEHTMGVMYTAGCLAMKYDIDIDQALLAGLLHDCAKCISHSDKLRMCAKYKIDVTDTERKSPGLLHAKLGAVLAKEKYGIKDPEIMTAIRFHTTGHPEMSMLDKILYIADYIEPGRQPIPNLEHIRKLAFEDIDSCLVQILSNSLNYLVKRNILIDEMTANTYEYYTNLMKKEEL